MGRRRLIPILCALAAACALPSDAGAASSPNVHAVASIPQLVSAISINFIGDSMFVSTAHGLYAYDVSAPAAPKLLGALPMYIWENEDVDVDPVRKRLF